MESIINTLDRYFRAFQDQKRDWDFFIGLADYMNLLDEIPEIKDITEKFKEAEEKMIDRIQDAEKPAIEEVKAVYLKMLKKLKRKENALMPYHLVEIKELAEGKKNPNWYDSAKLAEAIRFMVRTAVERGFAKDLKEFFPKNQVIEEFTPIPLQEICPAYSLRMALSYDIQDLKETELWGNYRKLCTATKIFQKGKERLEQMKKEGKDITEIEHLIKERDIIQSNAPEGSYYILSYAEKTKEEFSSSNDRRIKEFQRDKYQNYASRIHNHIIKELSRKNSVIADKKICVAFDKDKGILFIKDTPVKIRKFTNQYHLIKVIFQDEKNDWQFSELLEEIEELEDYNWKKLYDVANAIKKNIAAETGIKDFFITTTQSIKINKKYLE